LGLLLTVVVDYVWTGEPCCRYSPRHSGQTRTNESAWIFTAPSTVFSQCGHCSPMVAVPAMHCWLCAR